MRARSTSPGFLTRVSELLGSFRWAFMPLGLFALLAIGVHAAADALDDQILHAVDWWDSAMDGLFGSVAWTESWVDLIGLQERSYLARGTALVWELLADCVLALPAFGYRERERTKAQPDALRRLDELKRLTLRGPPAAADLKTQLKKPFTLMRVLRPLATGALCLAGACAVAQRVQGRLYLCWRDLFGDAASSGLARVLAIAALFAVLATLGWRAVWRNVEAADVAYEEGPKVWWRRWTVGWVGSLIVVPLAIVAWLSASPVLSFFR